MVAGERKTDLVDGRKVLDDCAESIARKVGELHGGTDRSRLVAHLEEHGQWVYVDLLDTKLLHDLVTME